jgi:hypothetical protein
VAEVSEHGKIIIGGHEVELAGPVEYAPTPETAGAPLPRFKNVEPAWVTLIVRPDKWAHARMRLFMEGGVPHRKHRVTKRRLARADAEDRRIRRRWRGSHRRLWWIAMLHAADARTGIVCGIDTSGFREGDVELHSDGTLRQAEPEAMPTHHGRRVREWRSDGTVLCDD